MATMFKETQARIKINKLLEEAGWRFSETNRQLVRRFEAKIKVTIARVWSAA